MKKEYYYLLTMMLAAAISIGFVSCGSDDDSGSGSRDGAVVGTWYDTSHSRTVCAFRFDKNGNCYYNEWMEGSPRDITDHPLGKWSTNDGILTIVEEGYDEEDGEYYRDEETYTYLISEDGKSMVLYEDGRMVYDLHKQ